MTTTHLDSRPVVVVNPDAWDYRELTRSAITKNIPMVFFQEEIEETFDPEEYLRNLYEKLREIRPLGILSTDDYPGSLLSNIAARQLGLPGTPPDVALLCQHKFLSRQKQQECIPEAVPSFWLVPRRTRDVRTRSRTWKFPFFVKPVKSGFQMFADAVENYRELTVLRRRARRHLSDFTKPFNAMFRLYGGAGPNASALLAEELLSGQPFTVEGFVYDGRTTILGVVDAYYYRGTRSYQRFQYPSSLSVAVQQRAADLIARLMTHLQYRHGLFNVDCLYNRRTDRIYLLEVNPRMAAQIADLFEKVDGTNSYSVLLSLACGRRPKVTVREGCYRVAASFVLRRFGDRRVVAINEPEAVLAKFPDARAHVYIEPNTKLSDDEFQDMRSYVYAIVNIGAQTEKDLWRKFRMSEALLAARFRPV
jgi:hypothetical protein